MLRDCESGIAGSIFLQNLLNTLCMHIQLVYVEKNYVQSPSGKQLNRRTPTDSRSYKLYSYNLFTHIIAH